MFADDDADDPRPSKREPVALAQATAPDPAPKPPPKPSKTRFTVSVSGDLLMHQPLLDRALANGNGDRYDFAPFFKPIRRYIEGIDYGLCHLETPMGPGPPATYPIFNTPTDLADSIERSGWDACSTASNHSVDQGLAGIEGTISALHKVGLEHTGSFRSERARERPTTFRVKGVKVGLIAYTDATNGLPTPTPWSVAAYDAENPQAGVERILADAKRARKAGAEAIIVQLHWGTENASRPNASQLEVAKRLTESKLVTVVVGQGPHVVQPIERMNGKFVVFSEGNLVSNQSASVGLPAATQDGLVALLRFVARGDRVRVARLRYVPVWVRPGDYAVLPAFADEDPDNAGALRSSHDRTVATVGSGNGFGPVGD